MHPETLRTWVSLENSKANSDMSLVHIPDDPNALLTIQTIQKHTTSAWQPQNLPAVLTWWPLQRSHAAVRPIKAP